MKQILGLFAVLFLASSFTTKTNYKKDAAVQTISILTSAVCGECKERIEKELNYTKGVVFAELDVDTKIVTIKYKAKTISQEEIVAVITNLGYDAGEAKRNEEAFNKLPKCCQSPGHCSRD